MKWGDEVPSFKLLLFPSVLYAINSSSSAREPKLGPSEWSDTKCHQVPVVVEELIPKKHPQTVAMTRGSGSPGVPTASAGLCGYQQQFESSQARLSHKSPFGIGWLQL